MNFRARHFVVASPLVFLLSAACTNDVDLGNDNAGAAGAGASASAGATASGGATATGGAQSVGGGQAVGGSSSSVGGGQAVGGSSSSVGGGQAVGGSSGSVGGGQAVGGSSGSVGGGPAQGGASSSVGGGPATGGSGGASDPCPPNTLKGTLSTVLSPATQTSFGPVVEDLRVGKNNVYVLNDPWVYFAFYGGKAPLTSTLPLNENLRQLAVLSGSQTVNPSFQTSDKVLFHYFQDNDETLFALKTKDGILNSTGEGNPGFAADGTDLMWALRVPARVVEAELAAGGAERVLGDYGDGTTIVPTAVAFDAGFIYWTTASMSSIGIQAPSTLYRAGRHGASAAESLGSISAAVDQILVDGNHLHLAYARGGDSYVGETRSTDGMLTARWGSNTPVSFRMSRMVALDGQVYWTEHRNNTCEGRLLRHSTSSAQNPSLDLAETLIDNLNYPGNLAVHEGTIYFTTPSDPTGHGGALYSYVPSTPGAGCHGCGSIYASGAQAPVCGPTGGTWGTLVSCAAQSCINDCASGLVDPTLVLTPACKACIAAPCATEVAACQAEGDG